MKKGTLLIGTLLGSLSGVLVAFGGIQPFIATLVTMTLLRGDDLSVAIRYAQAAAALSVQTLGAQSSIPEQARVEIFLQKNTLL